MKIIKEDPKLGISKVVWRFTEDHEKTVSSLDPSPSENMPADESPGEPETLIDAGTGEPDMQPDHMADMRQQVRFLQQVIESQNQQLHTKDELIRNFQVLLKSEQEQVLRLESRMGGYISDEEHRGTDDSWFQLLIRKLKKQ